MEERKNVSNCRKRKKEEKEVFLSFSLEVLVVFEWLRISRLCTALV